jgi:hypothetical protein
MDVHPLTMNNIRHTFRAILTAVLIAAFGTASAHQRDAAPQRVFTDAVTENHAEKVIRSIVSVVGLQPNFEIRAADVPNAAAVIVDNKRYILYNPEFMNAIDMVSRTHWAGISILAHEIGHHLNGHTLEKGGSKPELELEADEFSGFVLNKMGATLQESQTAMTIAASQKASHTHPAKQDRLVAIANGWNNARALKTTETVADRQTDDRSGSKTRSGAAPKPNAVRNAVVKPVIVTKAEVKSEPIAEKYIAFDVNFHADRSTDYYITVRGNLVAVNDDELYIVGRLSESNRRGYSLMLADKNYNYLYIGKGGKIVNGSGRTVGTISKHE